MAYCPSCGRTVPDTSHFCNHCGTDLRKPSGTTHKERAATPPPIPKAPVRSAPKPTPASPPPVRKKGCGFGAVLLTLLLLLGGGAAWFFTQQFRLERAAYERIRHSNSIDEIEQFLQTRMYMPDEHRRAAQARILRLQTDSSDFVNATTIEACEHYLTIHPDGSHVDEVQARLNRLRREQPTLAPQVDTARRVPPPTIEAESNEPVPTRTEEDTPQATVRYHVVVGSFSNSHAASDRVATLRATGYSANVVAVDTSDGTVYRVVISSHNDAASAQRAAATLRRQFPDAWVMAH